MSYQDIIEEAARMFVKLELEDVIAVENVIERIVKHKKDSGIEHKITQKHMNIQ